MFQNISPNVITLSEKRRLLSKLMIFKLMLHGTARPI